MDEAFAGDGEVFVDRAKVIFRRFVSILNFVVDQFDLLCLKLHDAAPHRSDAGREIRRLHRSAGLPVVSLTNLSMASSVGCSGMEGDSPRQPAPVTVSLRMITAVRRRREDFLEARTRDDLTAATWLRQGGGMFVKGAIDKLQRPHIFHQH